jgi:hypothetical protein
MSETARATGNGGWCRPEGPISKKIAAVSLELKSLVQRNMGAEAVERATNLCNSLLAESERVAELETSLPVVLCHVPICIGGKRTLN